MTQLLSPEADSSLDPPPALGGEATLDALSDVYRALPTPEDGAR